MFHQIGYNDIVLLSALAYTCVDLHLNWGHFSSCSGPIHKWLFTSCFCAIILRLMRLFGSFGCASTQATPALAERSRDQVGYYFLLDTGHKSWLPKTVIILILEILFIFSNVLGSIWLWQVLQDTHQCVPSAEYLWFSAGWLLVTYMWLIFYVVLGIEAKKLRSRVQRLEAHFREVEDAETLERWGRVSSVAGIRDLADTGRKGLCPAAIKALPSETAPASSLLETCQRECSICLMDMSPGECVRCLPRCGHTFHRSCIDLWLVRQPDCPLCKQNVADYLP